MIDVKKVRFDKIMFKILEILYHFLYDLSFMN